MGALRPLHVSNLRINKLWLQYTTGETTLDDQVRCLKTKRIRYKRGFVCVKCGWNDLCRPEPRDYALRQT